MLQEYSEERHEFLGAMGCGYMYDVRQCDEDPEEENYKEYADCDTTRLAIHVGDQGGDSIDVLLARVLARELTSVLARVSSLRVICTNCSNSYNVW